MSYTEASILTHFDTGLFLEQKQYYPQGAPGDISYHFVLDLEHGYCYTAGSRIHLYADDDKWAVVAEINGYFNRALRAEIELHYFGNCIDYPISKYPERSYISNVQRVILIDGDEWNRICNRTGDEDEQFELVDPGTEYVMIRNARVPFESDVTKYRALGIEPRKFGNPRSLIGFEDLVRYSCLQIIIGRIGNQEIYNVNYEEAFLSLPFRPPGPLRPGNPGSPHLGRPGPDVPYLSARG